jgi:hypothetical protein
MANAVHSVHLLADEAFLSDLESEVAAQGSPPISFSRDGDLVTFECATGDFMLRARVADAMCQVLGERWREVVWPIR